MINVTSSYFKYRRSRRGLQATWEKVPLQMEGLFTVLSYTNGSRTGKGYSFRIHSCSSQLHTPQTDVLTVSQGMKQRTTLILGTVKSLNLKIKYLLSAPSVLDPMPTEPQRENEQVQTTGLPSLKYDLLSRSVSPQVTGGLFLQHAKNAMNLFPLHMQTEPCPLHTTVLDYGLFLVIKYLQIQLHCSLSVIHFSV